MERRLLVAEACGAVASYLPVRTQPSYVMFVCECVCMCVRWLHATKNEKCNGQPKLACLSVQHPPLKTSECMVLHMPASREMMEQID